MSGFGRFDRQSDRFKVPHLADEDDIGILAKRTPQGRGKGPGVRPHLPVVDQTALALVHELDRVLDRNDVVLAELVGVVDDGGERRGLAAARRSGEQDQSFVQQRGPLDDGRKPQLIRRVHLGRNLPEHRPATVLLVEEIAPEARHARNLVPEVDVAGLLVLFDLQLGGDLIEHRLQRVVLQHLVLDPLHIPVKPDNRLLSGRQVQVGGPLIEHQLKERVYLRHSLVLTRLSRPVRHEGPHRRKT